MVHSKLGGSLLAIAPPNDYSRIRPIWNLLRALVLLCLSAQLSWAVPILVPGGLSPGDKYHLAFVSSTSRDATSSDIGVYNSFVQAAADAAGIGASEGVFWKAIASTRTVKARDNALVSAPVYRMDGQQLATGFSDLWGSSLNASLSLDEYGLSLTSVVWTGTNPNGSQASHPLGVAAINTGFTAPGELVKWIKNGEHHAATISYPLYALSSELTVPAHPVPEPGTLVLLLTLGLASVGLRRYRRAR